MTTTVANIALYILLLAIVIALIRLIKGPSLPDRILALDLIAYISLGFVVAFSLKSNNEIYLDYAMMVASIIFLGAIIISLYLKKRKYDK